MEGFGIGLSLAKVGCCLHNTSNTIKCAFQELTELHGGQLRLSSRTESELDEDTGSVFTIVMPLGADHLSSNMIADNSEAFQSRPSLVGMDHQQLE